MRYCVFSSSLSIDDIVRKVTQTGGKNIREVRRLKQVFCELDPTQTSKLSADGLHVKKLEAIRPAQISIPVAPDEEFAVHATEQVQQVGMNLAHLFNEFRGAYTPPLTGLGHTVAVLDTGIRKTHEALVGKVVYEENFSESPSCDDVFDHGTGIASIIAGGVQGAENSGVAPGARLINLKCINDDGYGTDEMLIIAIDRVCELVEIAEAEGLPLYDEDYPNLINISIGADDDGDPNNPLRLACRVAVNDYGLQIVAAIGNSGPDPSSCLLPACDEDVVAVGGLYSDVFNIWPYSARGPTKEGLVKPDFVMWATDVFVASSEADDEYAHKTGTSFSSPIAAGLIGLVTELGRRAYGSEYYATWYEIERVGDMVGIKPEDAPIIKDNSYGYGLPALQPLMRGVTGEVTEAPAVEVTDMIMLMMVMVPMAMIVKGV